ncbi:DUF3667 domain-containing protein [Chryseobacterium paludis]|uniref:DUF3667 domain-containing protein n=1 Tax=Chryseobacterium paludis TaxID=2956784 RepID=UPI0021C0106D|nr:DUF3667 domain-containing protein [Chryseobacterium paludis]
MEITLCKNCNFNYSGNYCPECGQSVHEKRIDVHWLIHDIPHSVFHIDKGFFYTLKCLFTNPGKMVEGYLAGKRVKHFRPFAYVILIASICTFVVNKLQSLTQSIYQKRFPNQVLEVNESFFSHYFSLFIFIMIPFASLITWLFFIKRQYNYWEHFLVNTYLAAQLSLLLVLINLIKLFMTLFSEKTDVSEQGFFISFFMTGFLFLYGYTYGSLMSTKKTNLLKISLTITVMNCLLFILYYFGLIITNVIH